MEIQQARHLDIDDLFIMTSLVNKVRNKEIAEELRISHSAVSMRLNKYSQLFGDDIFRLKGKTRKRELTPKGKEIFKVCQTVMDILIQH